MASSSSPLLSFEQARSAVENYASGARTPAAEPIALLQAAQRILAEPVCADRDIPPFRRATRDGFAVRAADTTSLPAQLRVVGELRAGAIASFQPLEPGQAIEIMTGAALPEGADAVVMVEHTQHPGGSVIIERSVRTGENWVPQGAEARTGDLLLSPGIRLNAPALALAASVGKQALSVYRKPAVAILATGDELVEVGAEPGPVQIRDSNSYSLAAQVRAAGGEPAIQPIVRDTEAALLDSFRKALSCDLLLISGGVSMGKYDLVEQALGRLGAKFVFTGAAIQPGKPVVFGTLPRPNVELPFFALPGNPVSTMVTFDLFVEPVLRRLAGGLPQPLRMVNARLKSEFRVARGLTRFLPAVLETTLAGATVHPVRWQGSGDIASVARSNCYFVVSPETERLDPGDWVTVLLRDSWG